MATANRGEHGGGWKCHQAGRSKRGTDRVAIAVRPAKRRRTGSASTILRGGGRNTQRIHFPRSGQQSVRMERPVGERRMEPWLLPNQDWRCSRSGGRDERLAANELRQRRAKHHADSGGAGRIPVLSEHVGPGSGGSNRYDVDRNEPFPTAGPGDRKSVVEGKRVDV